MLRRRGARPFESQRAATGRVSPLWPWRAVSATGRPEFSLTPKRQEGRWRQGSDGQWRAGLPGGSPAPSAALFGRVSARYPRLAVRPQPRRREPMPAFLFRLETEDGAPAEPAEFTYRRTELARRGHDPAGEVHLASRGLARRGSRPTARAGGRANDLTGALPNQPGARIRTCRGSIEMPGDCGSRPGTGGPTPSKGGVARPFYFAPGEHAEELASGLVTEDRGAG